MKINKNLNYIKLSFFATIILLSVVGCAVLKVDVDVYKGPMANHEDVQMQQLSVMAIGAKPLLVRLRDMLEDYKEEKWYFDGYIVADTDGKNRFKVDLAKTTNSILGLYNDQFPSQLAPLVNEGNRAYAKLKNHQENLNNKTVNESISKLQKDLTNTFWKSYDDEDYGKYFKKEFLIDFKDIDRTQPNGTSTSKLLVKLKENYDLLINNGICANDKVIDDIFKTQQTLWQKYNKTIIFANIDLNKILKSTGYEYDSISKVAKLKILADKEMLKAHSKLLLKPKHKLRKKNICEEFVSLLSTNAKDYVGSVSSLETLLQLALKGINIANTSDNILSECKLDDLKSSASEFAYALIDQKALETALKNNKKNVNPNDKVLLDPGLWNIGSSTPILKEKFLAHLCDIDNATNANNLLTLHLKSKNYKKIEGSDIDFSFGIVKNSADISSGIKKIGKKFRGFANLANSSLDRGRLASGIETLIENYLNAEEENCKNEDGYNCAKDKLIDAMVRFAEKIKTLVNNEAILQDCSLLDKKDRKKYTLLLESIGNSIIIQADELRHKETHDNELKMKKDAELLAINRALLRTPDQVIDDLTLGLRSNILNYRKGLTSTNLKKIKLEEEIKAILPVDSGSVDAPDISIVSNVLEEYKIEIKMIGSSFDNVSAAYNVLFNVDSIESFVLDQVQNMTNTGTITERIIQWHGNEIGKKDQSDPWFNQLGTSSAYFNGVISPTFDPPLVALGTKTVIYEKIKEYVKTKKEAFNNTLSSRKSSYNNLNGKNNELNIVNNDIKTKENTINENEITVSVINENKADVIIKTSGSDVSVSPSVTFSILNDVINTKLGTATVTVSPNDGTETVRLKVAKNVLTKITPPMDDLNIESKLHVEKMNSKDVIDTLIAVLRNEHVLAIRAGGGDYANHIKAALDAAYGHRSGMVYIRPPSAYLRSSYPVTTLQDNPQLSWKNLLSEHALRVLPFAGPINNLANRESLRLRKEIDKQFWHNINSVRVSGVGNTNFVLVKDDVGNWYVKRYSSNPESIIKSAQSLAMFNMGPSMGVDMISRLSNYNNNTENGEKNDASLTKIEELFVKYTDEFKAQTVEDYNFIVNVLNGINSQEKLEDVVKTVVTNNAFVKDKSDMKSLINKEVEATATKVLEPVRKDLVTVEVSPGIKIDEDLGGETINLLYSMVRFNNVLTTNIKLNSLITGTASSNLKAKIVEKKASEKELTDEIERVKEIKANISIKQNEMSGITAEITKKDSVIRNLSISNPGTGTTLANYIEDLKREKEKIAAKVDNLDKEIKGLQVNEKTGEGKVLTFKDELDTINGDLSKNEKEFEDAKQAEANLIVKITKVVGNKVLGIYNLRDDSVKDYETAIMFIGDAVNPDNGSDRRRGERSMSNRAETVDTVRTAIDRIGTLRSGGIGERLEDLRELERRRDRRRNRPGIRASSRRGSAAGFRLLGNP